MPGMALRFLLRRIPWIMKPSRIRARFHEQTNKNTVGRLIDKRIAIIRLARDADHVASPVYD